MVSIWVKVRLRGDGWLLPHVSERSEGCGVANLTTVRLLDCQFAEYQAWRIGDS